MQKKNVPPTNRRANVVKRYTFLAKEVQGSKTTYVLEENSPNPAFLDNFKFATLEVPVANDGLSVIQIWVRTDVGRRDESTVISDGDFTSVINVALGVYAGKIKTVTEKVELR